MTKIKRIYIAPTYNCNLDCSYCYAKKYRNEYSEMTWDSFLSCIDILIRNNIQQIILTGGEPSIWPYIDRAIYFLKSIGISIEVLTNSVKIINSMPNNVFINANNILDINREKILNNILEYHKNGVIVTLRFNISAKDNKKNIDEMVYIVEKYADFVSVSPIVPYNLERELGINLFYFIKEVINKKISIKFSRAVPLCIFSDDERQFLKTKKIMYNLCDPCIFSFVINPDKTVFPCVDIKKSFRLTKNIKNLQSEMSEYIKKLHNIYPHKNCEICGLFLKECQGGCFSMHLMKTNNE